MCAVGSIVVGDCRRRSQPRTAELLTPDGARDLDNSEERVWEAYQHIEAAERADMAMEAFSQNDQRVHDE